MKPAIRFLVGLTAVAFLVASVEPAFARGRVFGRSYHRSAVPHSGRLPYPSALIYNPNAGFAPPRAGR